MVTVDRDWQVEKRHLGRGVVASPIVAVTLQIARAGQTLDLRASGPIFTLPRADGSRAISVLEELQWQNPWDTRR